MNVTRLPRLIRKLRGKESQQKFATRLDMSLRSLSNYERGVSQPGHVAMAKLFSEAQRQGNTTLAEKMIRQRHLEAIMELKKYVEENKS